LSRLFCQDQDQDFYLQDQDQDFIFCPRGASRPRLWSRGLHHWIIIIIGVVWWYLSCRAEHLLTCVIQKLRRYWKSWRSSRSWCVASSRALYFYRV